MKTLIFNEKYSSYIGLSNSKLVIESYIQGNLNGNFILTLPTKKLAKKFENYSILTIFNKKRAASPDYNFFTLDGLAKFIYSKIQKEIPKKLLSEAMQNLFFEAALESVDLDYFTNLKATPSIRQSLSNAIMSLRSEGIDSSALLADINILNRKSEISKNGFSSILKLQDIYNIMLAYEKILEGKYIDMPEIYSTIIQTNYQNDPKTYFAEIIPEIPLIFLEGFSEFSALEMEFITALAQSDIPFALKIDYSAENGPLFGNLDDLITKLQSAGLETIEIQDEIQKDKYESTEHLLRNHLFFDIRDYSKDKNDNIITLQTRNEFYQKAIAELRSKVTIFEANNQDQETLQIIKLIKTKIIKEGFSPSDICVSFRSPDYYAERFRILCANHGIPVFIADRYRLEHTSIFCALKDVLNLIRYEYRFENVIEVLQNSYINFNVQGQQVNAENIIYAAKKMRFGAAKKRTGRLKEWTIFLNKTISTLRHLDLKSLDLDDLELSAHKEKLNRLVAAREDLELFGKSISSLKNSELSAQEFNSLIKSKILVNLGIENKIMALVEQFNPENPKYEERELFGVSKEFQNFATHQSQVKRNWAESECRAFSEIIKVLDEMTGVLIEIEGKEKKYEFDALCNKFFNAIEGARFNIREVNNYGVTITSIEQTRGVTFKVLILCGADATRFPVRFNTDSLLGRELPDSEDRHIRSERMLFYNILTNDIYKEEDFNQQVYITYSSSNETGEQRHSPFLDSYLQLVNTENKSIEQLRNEFRNNFEQIRNENLITSKGELHSLIASSAINDKETSIISQINSQILGLKQSFDDSAIASAIMLTDNISKMPSKYSISKLDEYNTCSYKYFTNRILKLNVNDEQIVDLVFDPLEKGSLLHKIAERFIKSLISNNQWTDFVNNYKNHLDSLHKIANEEINLIKYDHPFYELERRVIVGNTYQDKSILNQWAKWQAIYGKNLPGIQPKYFEQNYTFEISDDLGNKIEINGKIDRIDAGKYGENNVFFVIDYKSKFNARYKNSKPGDERRTDFQMPIYINAVLEDKQFIDLKDFDKYSALYSFFDFRDSKRGSAKPFTLVESQLGNIIDNEEIIKLFGFKKGISDVDPSILKQVKTDALEVHKNLISTQFEANPKDDFACKYCDFEQLCRIKEQ